MKGEKETLIAWLTELTTSVWLWIGSAMLAWTYLMVLEWAMSQERFLGSTQLSQVAFLVGLAGVYALLASVPVGLLHLLSYLLDTHVRRRWGTWLSTLVVGLLSVWPAWQQSRFLTSGDQIAHNPWGTEIRWALFLAFVSGMAALWLWHLELIRAAASPPVSFRKWLLKRIPGPVWYGALTVAGMFGAAMLFNLITSELTFYAYLAAFLIVPTWFMAATIAMTVLRLHQRAAVVVVALTGLLFIGSTSYVSASWVDRQETRNRVCNRYQLAGLTSLQVFGRSKPRFRFDVSQPARFRCRAVKARELPSPVPVPDAKRGNVILISIDALRSDMLDYEHKGKALTPNLRAFAPDSLHYTKAVTTYPATLFAVGSALTGLNASQILFSTRFPGNIFSMTRETVERQFMSLPSSKWFRQPVIAPLFIQDTPVVRASNAGTQTRQFIRRLRKARKAGERTLAWVHFFDPHMPYKRHKGFHFGRGKKGSYLSEVAYCDYQFGLLIDYLRRDGWLEDSLVVVFADHGQALGERRYWGHHVYLNSFVSDIPIMVYAPGLKPGVTDELASIADIAPTVLHFLGLPVPRDMAGISLFLTGDRRPEHIVSEAFPIRSVHLFNLLNRPLEDLDGLEGRIDKVQTSAKKYEPKVALVKGDYRLIVNRDSGGIELYHRDGDVLVSDDHSEEEPERVAEMLRLLQEWHFEQSQWFYCRMANESRRHADEE